MKMINKNTEKDKKDMSLNEMIYEVNHILNRRYEIK